METKTTATKANWAGVGGAAVTVASYLIARFTGAIELPGDAALTDALMVIGNAVVGFLITRTITWLSPANKPT